MPDDVGNVSVTYTVKELLGNIQTEQTKGFARIEQALNGKADRSDIAAIQRDVAHLGDRFADFEKWRQGREVSERERNSVIQHNTDTHQRRWNMCLAVAVALSTVAYTLEAFLH